MVTIQRIELGFGLVNWENNSGFARIHILFGFWFTAFGYWALLRCEIAVVLKKGAGLFAFIFPLPDRPFYPWVMPNVMFSVIKKDSVQKFKKRDRTLPASFLLNLGLL